MSSFKELAPSVKKEITEKIKFILRVNRQIEPKQQKIKLATEELKLILATHDCTEVVMRAANASVVFPVSQVWDSELLIRALKDDELDVLMPRTPEAKTLNAKVTADPVFAARVAGCVHPETGTARLSLKAV